MAQVTAYKVDTLVGVKPEAIVALKVPNKNAFELYVTNKQGVPYPLDLQGDFIKKVKNADGNLTISGTSTVTINISNALLNTINSALQAGDNISDLVNDAGYITIAEVPVFVPNDYDLVDFTNTSLDPFVKTSELAIDLDTKVDKVTGKSLISDTEITRLGTLANYTHPANHPPSIITQDASNRFTTDIEKSYWNAKQPAGSYEPANANIQSHIIDVTTNPHSVTKTQVGLGNVPNLDTTAAVNNQHTHANKVLLDSYTQTEANIADAVTKKHSHSNIVALDAVLGVNTGDQDLSGLVVKNVPITGATKTKITYDTKGLVTAGVDATTADIADSLNKRYVSDAERTAITHTNRSALDLVSGTNTGDNATNTQYSGLEASKENTANKQNSLATDGTGVKFPTVDAVNAGITNSAYWTKIGDDIYKNNIGNVGIGTIAPGNKLEVTSGVSDNSGIRFSNITSSTRLSYPWGGVNTDNGYTKPSDIAVKPLISGSPYYDYISIGTPSYILESYSTTNTWNVAATGQPIYKMKYDSLGNLYYTSATGTYRQPVGNYWFPQNLVTTITGTALEIDANNDVYIANSSNILTKITASGVVTTLGTFGGTGAISIAVSPLNGDVYIVRGAFNSKQLYKVTQAGVSSTVSSILGSQPLDIKIDTSGYIYIADYGTGNVFKLDPTGTSIVFSSAGLGNPYSLIVKDSKVFVLDRSALGGIYNVNTTSGTLTKISSVGSYPTKMVQNINGDIYVLSASTPFLHKVLTTKESTGVWVNGDGDLVKNPNLTFGADNVPIAPNSTYNGIKDNASSKALITKEYLSYFTPFIDRAFTVSPYAITLAGYRSSTIYGYQEGSTIDLGSSNWDGYGFLHSAYGHGSSIWGTKTARTQGYYSTAIGGEVLQTSSYGEIAMGYFNTPPLYGNETYPVGTDRLMTIGNGVYGAHSDAFNLLKNGLMTLPSVTNALITDEPTGKAVVTKEYLNTTISGIPTATNLSYTAAPTNGIVVSDTGTDATLPLADATNAGLLKPAKYTVLENTSGINTGDNATNTQYSGLVSNATHTGDVTGATALTIGALKVTDGMLAGSISDSKILSATTWNAKQNALTNPITGTGTINKIPKWLTSSTQGDSSISDGTTGVLVSNSITAATAIARGTHLTPTLVASANNDVLVGLDIQPTFTNGAFTGVGNYALRISAPIVPSATLSVNIGSATLSFFNVFGAEFTSYGGGDVALSSQILARNINFKLGTGGTTVGRFAGTSGNLLLQTGGTFTDDGINRLQINGSIKATGTAAMDLPTYGAEFLLTTTWTSAGWTGDFTTGWIHTTGNTSILSHDKLAVNATRYQIAYTVTGRTLGSFTVGFGGQSTAGITTTGAVGNTTISTAALTITPTTDFNGTIVISIKAITAISTPIASYWSSDGVVRTEIRASNAAANTSVGNSAGRFITTGTNNSNFGTNAGFSITTGGSNSNFGGSAGQNITTGGNNSFFGTSAGQAITTGASNSNFGSQAGRWIADGVTANITGSGSVFIGDATKALADAQTNQIVIGQNAIGAGTNTATLGNTSITKTVLRGNVETNGSVKVGDDVAAASASNVGALRYRTTANSSIVEMCMQISATTYVWSTIITNTW